MLITNPIWSGILKSAFVEDPGGGGDLVNWGASSNGGVASASGSLSSAYSPAAANNGVRHTNNQYGMSPATGSAWVSENYIFIEEQWLQLDFASKAISRVDVICLPDAADTNVEPTLDDIANNYNPITFDVQYWNGSGWTTITGATGNNKVWRQFTFAPVTTTKIRVLIWDANGAFARLVEVEAWGI